MPLSRPFIVLLLGLIPGLLPAADSLILLDAQRQALGIRTAVVGQLAETRSTRLPARVRLPNEQLRVVAAPLAGRIDSLLVAPGDSVRRGQVIARLSSPEALSLQRDVAQANSQATLLQQNLRRDEQLFAEGLIAESRLLNTRSQASQARAQASERQQALQLSGASSGAPGGSLALTAPISGVVLEQQAQVGERVDAYAAIYHIGQLSPLWLEVQAPLTLASRLKVGQTIALADSKAQARLETIGRAVDPASQTVLLRARVDDDTLRPGQLTEVELPGQADSQQHIPASAVVKQKNRHLAFVETEHSTQQSSYRPQAVKILHQGGETLTVDGLQAGEKIVTHGVSGLKALLNGVGNE